MYVCDSLQVIFLAQPRTASRSCAYVLKALTGVDKSELAGGHHALDEEQVKWRKAQGWRVVTAVRNHYDAIVSWYHHNHSMRVHGEAPPFRDYLFKFPTNKRNKHITEHALYWRYQPVATHIIRYENLWDDFEAAIGVHIPVDERPHAGQTHHRPYAEYYDDELREFVKSWYGEEMEKYGYE